ncbi:Calcipressin [Xylona heveae TC161]|uniref:Calcipressin n=1 Tax=Xylona heveae (strain CBS 132557 / TC161) TaxID=1328760 RepID=A0A165A6J1_XYLHT|nr:Calcipressin [Xylona heveae TC161]KZF20021.1 Calcipressin [Xylona heveae TC161]
MSSRGHRTPSLSLDLSAVPALIQPSPPSNTLLITNLQDPAIFHPSTLHEIRTLINDSAQIHSWSPLRSFRRIIVSFYDEESAIKIRKILDGEAIMGHRVRVYFGEPTPIQPVDQHLGLPDAPKLFFISPPPSPPHGWELRNEDPPNKEVHAEDLADALSKLHATQTTVASSEPASPVASPLDGFKSRENVLNRHRSGSSTMLYHPQDHGGSPDLPAIAVEDTTDLLAEPSPIESSTQQLPMAHTSRPPVELMSDA